MKFLFILKMDISGIEPEVFRMQSERGTTAPYTQLIILIIKQVLLLNKNFLA